MLTTDGAIAHRVLKQLNDHVENIQTIRALGFCVSIQHAQFMARVFNQAGLESLAIWSDTPPS